MARPLKIYTVQSHASFAPYGALVTVGAPRHAQQAYMYVAAYNKKDAAQHLNNAGAQQISPRHITEARGYCFETLRDSTDVLHTERGIAVMWNQSRSGGKVATLQGGNWGVIGEVTYADPANPRKVLNKPIFIPVKPVPEPVRVTIELDANTDPAILAEITKIGLSVIVASAINEKATGTVVES